MVFQCISLVMIIISRIIYVVLNRFGYRRSRAGGDDKRAAGCRVGGAGEGCEGQVRGVRGR